MKLHVTQLPCDEAHFLRKYEDYKAARAAHKQTVGQPAPWPEYEVFRAAYERGAEFEIVKDELQEQAKREGRNALSELDSLKARVKELEAQVQGAR